MKVTTETLKQDKRGGMSDELAYEIELAKKSDKRSVIKATKIVGIKIRKTTESNHGAEQTKDPNLKQELKCYGKSTLERRI